MLNQDLAAAYTELVAAGPDRDALERAVIRAEALAAVVQADAWDRLATAAVGMVEQLGPLLQLVPQIVEMIEDDIAEEKAPETGA